jgi:hypothetical protein
MRANQIFSLKSLGALTTSNLNLRGPIVSFDCVLNEIKSHETAMIVRGSRRTKKLVVSG